MAFCNLATPNAKLGIHHSSLQALENWRHTHPEKRGKEKQTDNAIQNIMAVE